MSVQDTLVTAIRDVLGSYLAPELAEQLTDDIVQRAAPEIEAAFASFVGFDIGSSRGSKSAQGRVGGRQSRVGGKGGRRRLHETPDSSQTAEARDESSQEENEASEHRQDDVDAAHETPPGREDAAHLT